MVELTVPHMRTTEDKTDSEVVVLTQLEDRTVPYMVELNVPHMRQRENI